MKCNNVMKFWKLACSIYMLEVKTCLREAFRNLDTVSPPVSEDTLTMLTTLSPHNQLRYKWDMTWYSWLFWPGQWSPPVHCSASLTALHWSPRTAVLVLLFSLLQQAVHSVHVVMLQSTKRKVWQLKKNVILKLTRYGSKVLKSTSRPPIVVELFWKYIDDCLAGHISHGEFWLFRKN